MSDMDGSKDGVNARDTTSKNVSRKDFMGTAGTCACLGGLSLAITGALRSAVPSVLPDASAHFRIGSMSDYVPGQVKYFVEENVVLFHDEEGLFAISTICTHLGCVVNQNKEGFQCPCHGSKYDQNGEVTQGPAPKALSWYQIAQLPGGQLSVDRANEVPIGTKFKFDIEEKV